MSLLHIYRNTINEQRVIEKFLCVVHKKYPQIAMSIETLLNVAELTTEEVTGWLKVVDDRDNMPSQSIAIIRRQALLHRGAVARSDEEEA